MSQPARLGVLLRNAVRPGYLPEMLRKVRTRLRDRLRGDDRRESVRWARDRAESLEDFATELDPELWAEAQHFAGRLADRGAARLAEIPGVDLGGGGDYRLLYFLVRLLRPARVVETGVAAGFSSAAILEALARNGGGVLHSSDFPYFRLENPERYIGWVVPEERRRGWDLRVRGDRENLPAIAAEVDRIDVLHYDSDKSYDGRRFALDLLGPLLGPRGVVVMDDIQDNFFFRDWVTACGHEFRVFEFGGKWVGLVGLDALCDAARGGDTGSSR